ncbi:MAG: DNA-directed RNA polymerase subunit beta [Candidatus Pristimantibacillus sp.]
MSMADERVPLSRKKVSASLEEQQAHGDKPSSAAPSGNGKKKKRSKGARVTLWILRKSIVPIIMVIMLIVGLYVGYVVVGKQPSDEVFLWSTWQHLYDLIFADS